jgi:hypothetical protein
VAPILGIDPFSGHVFIFRGKRADYMKILYYDGSACASSPSGWNAANSSGRQSSTADGSDARPDGSPDRGDRLAPDGRS